MAGDQIARQRYSAPGIALIQGAVVGILEQILSLFRRAPPAVAPTPAPVRPAVRPAAVATNQALAPERRGKERINAREGTRVLIIDDSKTVVSVLKKFLRSAGYETLEALDAESGLAQLHPQPPELIFLDIVLPGMNGFAALRAIRRDPATRNIPVIMMSGNEQAMEQFFGTRIGADDFMKKPFSRQEVFFRIERLLDDDLVPKRATPRIAEQAIPSPAVS